MSQLFTKFKLRQIEFRNRIFVSPMCQYSSIDGLPTDWHFVHLGSRAVGGAALVMVEATAVSAEGRISPSDSGIWTDQQAQAFERITKFIKEQGSVPAIQLAHAGRKASTDVPWSKGAAVQDSEGGWTPIAPSPVAFKSDYRTPKEMSGSDIKKMTDQFAKAAERSLRVGFEVVELHMAHGYLLNEFLSPLTNLRKDSYGGSFENRIRFPIEVVKAVREIWPKELPLFVRISAVDWADGGWDLAQSVAFAKILKESGVDLVDCSSGGAVAHQKIKVEAGYQVPFADRIRKEAKIPTGAVGLITDAKQAEAILQKGQADVVFMARELLRDPYWPLHAAKELGVEIAWPKQYERAK